MAEIMTSPALVIPRPNGITHTDHQLENLLQKLTTLRNDVLAASHPRLKLPAHTGDKGRPLSTTGGMTASSLPGLSNNTLKPAPLFGSSLPRLPPNPSYPKPRDGFHAPASQTAPLSSVASGINPIFLEKSDTLMKAEVQMKRERLEHTLEDQAHQKKNVVRNKTHDDFAMPNLHVDETLKNAHRLVPPLAFHREGPAAGGASSSDSFDENTFYSSQMNESTSTDGEVVEEPKRNPRPKLCRFYLNDKLCPYGDNCQFSHDPAVKAKADGSSQQAKEMDHVVGGQEASLRQNKSPHHPLPNNGKDGKNDDIAEEPTAQQQRIAQLEAELAAMKEKEKEGQQPQHHQPASNATKPQDNSRYIALGPDEFGRDISLRDQNAQQSNEVLPHDTRFTRESSRHDRNYSPPSANNVRVIRNHITSPYAPQPARVSPLAVAKVSHVQQVQAEGNRTSRIPYAEIVSDGSPNVSAQPLNSRKRRRGRDSGEQHRNVMPRGEASPQIRIKDEPVSPSPFNQITSRRNPVEGRGVRPERNAYQSRNTDRPGSVNEVENPGPPVRRIVSHNSQHYVANDEPDLRRIVSERQIRVPMLPAPRYVQYPDSEPRIVRASSQAYNSPSGQRPLQYRASIQPLSATHDRFPSPPERQMPSSPFGQQPTVSMAPPPRRVMVDQYGQRFLEPDARQVSYAPVNRSAMQPQYDQYENRIVERYSSMAPPAETRFEYQALRSQSVRRNFDDDDDAPRPIHREPSLASPKYVEYTRPAQIVEPRGEGSTGDSYGVQYPKTRVVYQETRPSSIYEQSNGQREGTYRVQSVRPLEDRYERTSRVPSVQPQPRIIQLTERQSADSPQAARPVSLHPEDRYARPVNYRRETQYQYVPTNEANGGYVPGEPDQRMYDTPRIIQRM